MERVRKLLSLPKLRIPTLTQLRDGSFFRDTGEEERDSEFSYLKEFEVRLVQAQEVALWSSPVRSLVWLLVSQFLVYYFTSSPFLPNIAKVVLVIFLYSTWVYRLWPAVRVPPQHPEDSEEWTPIHPDVLSAPELSSWLLSLQQKISLIFSGLILLHYEQPGKFCLISSSFSVLLALLGIKFSTAFILHSVALIIILLPGILVRAQKVPNLVPILQFVADFISGLGDLLIYRGLNAPRVENKDLDEFVPEVTNETETFLERALSYVQKKECDLDLSLASGLTIPSHEEVELDSLNTNDLETDLLPTTSGTLALEHGADLDTDSDCSLGPAQLSLARVGDYSEEDDDMFDLEPTVGPVMSLVTSSVTGVTASISSVSSTVSSVSALLGSFLTKNDSEPDLEDFELVNESDLELETPKI